MRTIEDYEKREIILLNFWEELIEFCKLHNISSTDSDKILVPLYNILYNIIIINFKNN